MPSWNKDRPDANEAWNIGDGRIRDNFAFLESALQIISTFAKNPADPTIGMYGKFAHGNAVDRPVMTTADQTGVIYFAQDTTQLFVCANGVGNIWTEIHRFAEAVTFTQQITAGNGILVTGGNVITLAMTVAGALSIAAGATLAAAQTLTVPAGNWLVDASGAMNVHGHGARHRPGGTDGAWTSPSDFVPYSLQRIIASTTLLHGGNIINTGGSVFAQAFGAAGDAKCSVTINTTGRPTTSRGLLLAEATCRKGAGGGASQEYIELGLHRDAIGTNIGPRSYRFFEANVTDSQGVQTMHAARYVTGLSAGVNHEFAMHLYSGIAGGVLPVVTDVQLLYLDLGTE